MRAKDYITAKQLIDYENKNHVVSVYPRKHIACIDGFKYYKINAGTLFEVYILQKVWFFSNRLKQTA